MISWILQFDDKKSLLSGCDESYSSPMKVVTPDSRYSPWLPRTSSHFVFGIFLVQCFTNWLYVFHSSIYCSDPCIVSSFASVRSPGETHRVKRIQYSVRKKAEYISLSLLISYLKLKFLHEISNFLFIPIRQFNWFLK